MKRLTDTQRTILENLEAGRDPITGNDRHRPTFYGAYGGWARSFDTLFHRGLMKTKTIPVDPVTGNTYGWKLTEKGVEVLAAGGFDE